MLVLTRRVGEKIMIGENIQIIVLHRWNNVIQLGIIAPKNMPVYRQEIYEHNKKQASIRQKEKRYVNDDNAQD